MRKVIVLGLALLVSAAAIGAGPPIPQDPAKQEKRRRDRLEWNRRTLGGAYDKVGKRNPKWDEPARKALELAARMYAQEIEPVVTFAEIQKPAKAAIDAGCDDPLVAYLYVQSQVSPNGPVTDEIIRRTRETAKALVASPYPALRRMVTIKAAGLYLLSAKDPGAEARKEAEANFDAALGLIGESFARDERNEFWEDRWFENLIDLIRSYRRLGVEGPEAYRRVDAGLTKVADAKVLRLLVRGSFWYFYGWEARTEKVAAAVAEGDLNKFGKRAEVAQEALEEAWTLRPGVGRAAHMMLDIEKSIGGNRAAMELWFDRAMKVDGDDRDSCWSKRLSGNFFR